MCVFCKHAEGTELSVTLRGTTNHVAEAEQGGSCTVALRSPKSIWMKRHNFTVSWVTLGGFLEPFPVNGVHATQTQKKDMV